MDRWPMASADFLLIPVIGGQRTAPCACARHWRRSDVQMPDCDWIEHPNHHLLEGLTVVHGPDIHFWEAPKEKGAQA